MKCRKFKYIPNRIDLWEPLGKDGEPKSDYHAEGGDEFALCSEGLDEFFADVDKRKTLHFEAHDEEVDGSYLMRKSAKRSLADDHIEVLTSAGEWASVYTDPGLPLWLGKGKWVRVTQ